LQVGNFKPQPFANNGKMFNRMPAGMGSASNMSGKKPSVLARIFGAK
jgi:hypothetical protein